MGCDCGNGGRCAAASRPILWVLHLAYAWLPIGFVLLALAQVGAVGVSAGVHALAVGATGGLIIGMITRTARGHTGRPLRASRLEVAAYGLVTGAALLRVAMPLVLPQHQALWLIVAAMAWSGAFGLYLFVFTPWLLAHPAGRQGRLSSGAAADVAGPRARMPFPVHPQRGVCP